MSAFEGVMLNRVDSVEDAAEFLRWLGERRPILAIDTETTGLEWWTPGFARLVQFGDGMTGWTVSIRNWRGVAETALKSYSGPVVMHNAAFDMHTLENEGLPAPSWHNLHDTMILHHIQDPARSHALKSASVKQWGWEAGAGAKLLSAGMSKHNWTWATVPEEFAPYGLYAAMDTILTARLFGLTYPDVCARGMQTAYEREMAALAVMHRCETRGMLVDPTYTLVLRDEWQVEISGLRVELKELGIENPGSQRQVVKALEDGGWDPEEYTPTGMAKLDKIALAEICRELGINADIAAKVQRYRRLVKWSSAYLDAFLGKRADDSWHVHPSIRTLGARTGRMSITGPPLQTLPKGPQIRHCILPEPGCSMFAVDYDAQELRLFASFAQEQGLIDAFAEGKDLHSHTASLVYGTPYEDIGKDHPLRQIAKNTRFAQLYGAGPDKIAQTAGVAVHLVEEFIEMSDRVFPGIPRFMQEMDTTARVRLAQGGVGYVTSHGGRYLPADPDKLYSLVNYLIQGSASDILKTKIIELDMAGYGDWIMCPVHDELLFSIPDGSEDEMPKIKAIMEDHTSFTVPLTCSVTGPLSSWGDAYQ
jgi:DNA polymerase-1